MKFSLSWLKEYLETDADIKRISETLTAIGLEVEEITDKSAELGAFIVAEILEAKKHPNADKLQICKVNTGSEILQIVCGAANARKGIKVVLAPVGSIIPANGMKIKDSKIRDIESCGMLCSGAELSVDEDSEGILELPTNSIVGDKFASIYGLDDPIIEIAITPNRGDCLGVYGVARDLSAAGLGTLKTLATEKISGDFKSPISVTIENTKKTPLFIGRYIKNVKNGESPLWLQNRLKSIGLSPISTLVDITNFITFNFGRPSHVYDAKKIKGNIVVRDAVRGDKIAALNDKEYELEAGMTVIADDRGAVALGGIIGGEPTGCAEDTTDIFLEIALFDSISIAETGRKLQIDSDARYRFERNVDPAFAEEGMEVLTKMIIELCGGEASEIVTAGAIPNLNKNINFDRSAVKRIIGIDPTDEEIDEILISLGFTINGKNMGIPSWRSDVTIEHDIVEEIVRIYGFDKIPEISLPKISNFKPALSPSQKKISSARRLLASRGMKEAVTFSFMSSKNADLFNQGKNIQLANPISSDLDSMRPSILPNLLESLQRNSSRGFSDLSLFEIGAIFDSNLPMKQQLTATGIRAGSVTARNHYGDLRDFDIFDVKADFLEVISLYISGGKPLVTADTPDYYHPGKSGAVMLGKNVLGYFGEIHPSILKKFDIKNNVVGFEIFLGNLPQPKAKKKYARAKMELSNFQSVERDFAFIVDENILAGDILSAVRKSDKKLISDVSLFDVYAGKNMEEGKKSVAISIKLQPKDRTLTDDEIESVSNKVIESVNKAVGGIIRG